MFGMEETPIVQYLKSWPSQPVIQLLRWLLIPYSRSWGLIIPSYLYRRQSTRQEKSWYMAVEETWSNIMALPEKAFRNITPVQKSW
jgi:hypothetical protein